MLGDESVTLLQQSCQTAIAALRMARGARADVKPHRLYTIAVP